MNAITLSRRDVRDFTASVRDICRAHATLDFWVPEKPCDDREPALRDSLREAGWFDLPSSDDGHPFIAPAAVELGRALVSIDCVDEVLGHGVVLDSNLAGGVALGRYVTRGDTAWKFGREGVELVEVVDATPISHLDAQSVTMVQTRALGVQTLSVEQADAWIAAMTGYVVGLSVGASELAMEHAIGRMAFGKPLSSIEAVGIKLADSASRTEGIHMATEGEPSTDILRYAACAALGVMKDSHQILGALGFTREFPLQRFSRRASALQAWTIPMATALEALQKERI